MAQSVFRYTAFPIVLALFTPPATAQSLEGACVKLITSGLREYSIDVESSAYLHTVFQRHCEKSGQVKKSSLSLGLEAVIEEIPIKLTGNNSSSRESMQNFCKSYSEIEQNSKHTERLEDKIVREAYRSFDSCMIMAASGVIVRHEVRSFNDVDFFISPDYNGKITVKGIQTPPHVTCKGQNPNLDKAAADKFDLNTKIDLNPTQSLNMACVRSGRALPNGGGMVYDEAAITILTDIRPEGNYSAYIPPDTRIPESQASVLAKQMRELELENSRLQKSIDNQKSAFLSGITTVGAINGNKTSELNVFIPFKDIAGANIEFTNVPTVIATVDKGKAQSGVYWTVNITSVTTKGFNARIFSVEKMEEPNYGWSGAAAVQWIAYAKPKS